MFFLKYFEINIDAKNTLLIDRISLQLQYNLFLLKFDEECLDIKVIIKQIYVLFLWNLKKKLCWWDLFPYLKCFQ